MKSIRGGHVRLILVPGIGIHNSATPNNERTRITNRHGSDSNTSYENVDNERTITAVETFIHKMEGS